MSTKISMNEIHMFMHPTRFSIYSTLKEEGEPMYASQIAKKLGLDRKLVSYHMSYFSRHGFVTNEIGIANPQGSPAKAVRYYRLTDKADKIIAKFQAIKL